MTSDGTKCYQFNNANQMDKVTNCSGQTIAEYVYDYNGLRMVKRNFTGGSQTNSVVSWSDAFETIVATSGAQLSATSYYFVNNELVAKKNNDGTKNFFHNDHLGSTSVITSSSGTLVEETKYDPWGEILSGGTASKFLYTGQEHDAETGLDYYNFRYYNSDFRRFTQPDDIIQDVYNPQDLNRYSYVRNNPLKYTDPSGHIAWVPVLLVAGGGALGAYEAVTEYSHTNPNATWQQKVLVGSAGALLGMGSTSVSLLMGPGGAIATKGFAAWAAPAIAGGTYSGAQQVFNNSISKEPLRQNVAQQFVVGAVAAKFVSPIGNKLMPEKVGRPINVFNNRPINLSNPLNPLNKKSMEFMKRSSLSEIIGSNFRLAASAVITLFDPPKASSNKRK